MRKIKEVLRLKYALNKSQREIKQSCGIGKTTIQEYLRRAKAAGLTWPLPDDLNETALEAKLFPGYLKSAISKTPEISFQHVFEELKRPNVTISLLWEEYKQSNPGGYQYSWFSEKVRKYCGSVNYRLGGQRLLITLSAQPFTNINRLKCIYSDYLYHSRSIFADCQQGMPKWTFFPSKHISPQRQIGGREWNYGPRSTNYIKHQKSLVKGQGLLFLRLRSKKHLSPQKKMV